MTKTYEITEIKDVIEIGKTLTMSWFRGTSKAWNNLTPGIFRGWFTNDILRQFRGDDIEFDIIENFKRSAPAFTDKLPDSDDHIEWLLLMQHHGAPTRLLDWTESVLVALYFATNELKYRKEDGEIWALYPNALNAKSGIPGISLSGNPHVRYLAGEPGFSNREKALEELMLGQIPKFPIAFRPPLESLRMYSQFSTFTIHPQPQEQCTIPKLLEDETHLVRYVIPMESKEQIQRDLRNLKITRTVLFPDLDTLGASLNPENDPANIGAIAYSPPRPPSCGGEHNAES